MSAFPDILFLRPFWLIGLAVVLALALVFRIRRSRTGDWEKMIDPHLMAAMARLGRVDMPKVRGAGHAPFWAAGLICLAMTGPAMRSGDAQVFRNLGGVVFVMDVSASMTTDKVWPDVVTIARATLSGLGSKPAALIVFAGDSYTASALSTDRVHLGQTVALLDTETVPDKGSRPALALRQAAAMLDDAQIIAGDVVLITDGGGLGPQALDAAKAIAELDGRLSVIQARTQKSADDPDAGPALQALTKTGNGRLYTLQETDAVMRDFGRSDDVRLEKSDYRLLFWADYGRYLLVFALLPVAALFRRRAV